MKANKSLILVTYNREDLLKSSLESVDLSLFEKVIIVHDGGGKDYSVETTTVLNDRFVYLPQANNSGVGICKKLGIEYVLSNTESDHIFIMEDDVMVKDNSVWDNYIKFSERTGVYHTNWNDCVYSSTKFEIDFGDGIVGIITRDVSGAFSYFHRNMFKFCEFPMDMKNAFEHISVELQLIEKHLLPPFWNFICPKNTGYFLKMADDDSTITDKEGYSENYGKANAAFIKRHGLSVGKIQDVPTEKVLALLKFLKDNYAKQ